jgi:hypothetical protein
MRVVADPRMSSRTPELQAGAPGCRHSVERPTLRRSNEPAASCPARSITMAGLKLGI